MDTNKLINELTLDEKIALVSGTNFMETNPIPRLNIRPIVTADGPHGLRKQVGNSDNGISQSLPATSFPTAATIANSWDSENVRRMGEAIGKECQYYHVDVLLGPGLNIKRNPLCGRNFEYYSEDPYLTSKLGEAFTIGVQSQNVGVSLKHFAANNSENYRFMGNSIVDERALREIYLKSFENIVKNAKPMTVMAAYNQINGQFCSENHWLLNDVLREEWKFDGLVMSDWGGVNDRAFGIYAGLDLDMPGDVDYNRKRIKDSILNHSLDLKDLNEAVLNVLNLIDKTNHKTDVDKEIFNQNHILSKQIAIESAVLLKNNGTLPLIKSKSYLVVGELFEKMRYQGSGSSMINPTQIVTPKNAFDINFVNYTYCKGYLEKESLINQSLMDEVIEKSKDFNEIVLFVGLTDLAESEGMDRKDLNLPDNQVHLIEELSKLNKKLVLVLFGGSSSIIPRIESIDSILNMVLPGQNGGQACLELLFGDKNPSGKLAETWVNSYEDIPYGHLYSRTENEVYLESIFVGYRYYNTFKKDVLFPFGYGLSYTQFDYSNLAIEDKENEIVVYFDIKNCGNYDGSEIAQVYMGINKSIVYRESESLVGFSKVFLKQSEVKHIEIHVNKQDCAFYHVEEKRWVIEKGEYSIYVGSSSRDIRLESTIHLMNDEALISPYSDDVNQYYSTDCHKECDFSMFVKMSKLELPKKSRKLPLTMQSIFMDFNQTFFGKILYKAVLGVADNQLKTALKMEDGIEKDNRIKGAVFLERILASNSVRSLAMCGGKKFTYTTAEAFVEIANGHLIKGLRKLSQKLDVPPLPKDEKRG